MSKTSLEAKLLKATPTRPSSAKRRKAEALRMKEWTSFLKDDHDFDWACILGVLAYKLKRTREHITVHAIIADYKQVAAEILSVEKLLKRVLTYDYFASAQRHFGITQKYGRIIHKMSEDKDGRRTYAVRRSKETPKNTKQVSMLERSAYKLAEKEQDDDLRRAFGIMAQKIKGWWD